MLNWLRLPSCKTGSQNMECKYRFPWKCFLIPVTYFNGLNLEGRVNVKIKGKEIIVKTW